MGSTGDPPVPVGDSPTGRSRRLLPKGPSLLGSGAIPVPSGESPGGTGQWPVLPKNDSQNTRLVLAWGFYPAHWRFSPTPTAPGTSLDFYKQPGAKRRYAKMQTAILNPTGLATLFVLASVFHNQLTSAGGCPAPSFAAPVIYGAGTNSFSLAVGDFNGDGKPDLAVANYSYQGTVSVLLGNGDG